jgi:cobaltochelatase CobS
VKSLVPVEHVITIEKYDGSKVESTGRPHMLLQELVELCQLRMHSFLVGPAGSGKTTAVEQAANILELPYYSWSMGPSTSEWDLFGYRSPDGHYVPGILREPFETGGILCLDEMDNTNPNVLTALNSALANGHAQFPDGRVAKHPDFVCVAGGNTYGRGANRVYVGRMQLDGATLDRFGVINWDYDEEAEVDWAGRDQMTWVAHVQRIRHKAEQLGVRYIFSPRASINGAKMIRNGLAWERAEAVWLWKGIPEEDRSRLCE